MSGRLTLCRTNVNVRGYAPGTEIEVDLDEPGWASLLAKGRIQRVAPAPKARKSTPAPEPEQVAAEPAADADPNLGLIQ